MLAYNEKLVFDYSHYADVQLILYDDGIGQLIFARIPPLIEVGEELLDILNKLCL